MGSKKSVHPKNHVNMSASSNDSFPAAMHIALDLFARPPRVRWTSEMRIFLCCLIKYFEKRPIVFQAVFNSRFKKELEECGFGGGRLAEWPTLNTQWETMRRQGDPIWGDVHLSNFELEPWLPFITMIENTATSVGVQIVKKTYDNIDSSRFTYQNPDTQPTIELPVQLPQEEILQDEDPLQEPSTTTTPRRDAPRSSGTSAESSLCTAGGKICLWCYVESLDQKPAESQIPPLLYRWWNVDSQGVNSTTTFVAGLFAGSRANFAPDTISHDQYCRLFESHIRIQHTPSPFISAFKSALAPIHRALRNQEGASVSIIDTRKLKSNAYSALDFVREQKLKIGTYNGAGEYLVWGYIDSDAIICTFKITTILRLAAEHPDINRLLQLERISASKRNRRSLHKAMAKDAVYLDKKAGATVGKLLSLLQVPYEYCRTASEGIAYSWRVKTRRLPWRDFFEGVELGYRGEPVTLSPALSPVPGANNDDCNDSDSDLYTISEVSSDEADDNADIDEKDNESLNETETNDTPASSSCRERIIPLCDRDDSSEWQLVNRDFPITVVDSSDEEIGNAEDFDLFDEGAIDREETTSDRFADDRARVRSALNWPVPDTGR